MLGLVMTVAEIPLFQNNLRRNQTLKPLGLTLRENYRPGDAIVCWGHLPEGLAVLRLSGNLRDEPAVFRRHESDTGAV